MITKREARSLIRKTVKRVPEGEEIRHLNIMPMMDLMTILLVAMIFQANTSSLLDASQVDMPASQSFIEPGEQAVMLTLAPDSILVEGRAVPGVTVKNGVIDAADKAGGAFGVAIPKVSELLGAFRESYEADLVAKGKEAPKDPELMIVADKKTPYKTLLSVLYSAKEKPASYKRFRLIVLEDPGKKK